MLFDLSLIISMVSVSVGLLWRVWTWLSREVGTAEHAVGPLARLGAVGAGLLGGLKRPGRLAKALFWDVLFQGRVLQESPGRWLAHQAVFWGFVALILFHALEDYVSEAFLPEYYSTAYPYAMLRDMLGLLVLLGLVVFACRRWLNPVVRRVTRRGDVLILILLAVIILSGFALKATKIISQERFNQMVAENSALEAGPELSALEVFWHERFGVVFDHDLPAPGDQIMARGRQANQDSCADCHSQSQAAFSSHALSWVLAPMASGLRRLKADHWLWVVHFMACFLALALLPFSKLLHIAATPLSLLADAVLGRSRYTGQPEAELPPARAVRRALDLTACTGCATCSQHCAVLAASRVTAGDLALPSLKLAALGDLAKASPQELCSLREAIDLCTRCQRCTRVCPAGIDLQDLWSALDDEMKALGNEPAFTVVRRDLVNNQKANGDGRPPRALTVPGQTQDMGVLEMALQHGYFRYCFQCQTCSNVCPVVACFEHASHELGLLPHQIMYSLELGLVDQAVAAAMVWDCSTCYQCQEHCPQRVPVADLLYELRNHGFRLHADCAPVAEKEGR